MKKLKSFGVIGVMVAVLMAVMSLTSCLSNNDDGTRQSGGICIYEESMGSKYFLSLDGKTRIVAQNIDQFKTLPTWLRSGRLCNIVYQYNVSDTQQGTTNTNSAVSVQLIGITPLENGEGDNVTALDESYYNNIVPSMLPDTVNTQATVGEWTNTAVYKVYGGNYKLFSNISYSVDYTQGMTWTRIWNNNLFYIHYKEDDLKAGNLKLYFNRYTNNKDPKNTSSINLGVGSCAFDITDAVNAYKMQNGSDPEKVTVVVEKYDPMNNWKVTSSTPSRSYEDVKVVDATATSGLSL